MWEIRCDDELSLLKVKGQLPGEVFELVEQYYLELKEASYVDEGSFALEDGYIVVIDPVRDEWRTILDVNQAIWIEYLERIDLADTSVYRVGRILDNDMIMTYFVQAGINQEADEWLEEYRTS